MSFFTALVSSKIAAGLLAGGTIAAGGAAAAYTGVLPAPLQQGSHELIGAPAPAAVPSAAEQQEAAAHGQTAHGQKKAADAPEPESDGAGVGPDATGPAAFGLCSAFSHGGLDPASTAYKSLAAAAGNAGIDEYCKSVPAPGDSAGHRPDNPGNPDRPDQSDNQDRPDADGSSNHGSSNQGTTPDQASKAQASKSRGTAAPATAGGSHRPSTAGKP